MAYRGGYQRKATQVDYDGLVDLYVTGKARAETSREVVRKERGEQQTVLAKAQSEVDATNIMEMDNLFIGIAGNDRTILAMGQKANQKGLIGRGEVAQITSSAQSDINAMGQVAELKRQQYEDIQKGIDKGDLSPASLEQQQFSWFTAKDKSPILRFADGTERVAKRTMEPVVFQDKDGKVHQYVNVTQEFIDEDGEVRETTIKRKWHDIVNTDTRTIPQVTPGGKATSFIKLLSDNRDAAVINGQVVNTTPFYGNAQTLANGQVVYSGTIAPELFPDLQNSTELYLNTLNNNDIVSIIYDANGGTVFSPPERNFGKRKLDVVNEVYQNMYDEKGNQMTFKTDPLYIPVDDNGNYMPNEDNIKFAQALTRDRIYKAMTVTREEITSGVVGSGGSRTKTDIPISDITYMGVVEGGSRDKPLDAQHLFSVAKLNGMAVAANTPTGSIAGTGIKGVTADSFLDSRYQMHQSGQLSANDAISAEILDVFAIKDESTGQYSFENVEAYGKNIPLLQDEVGKNKVLDISTMFGQEFSTASGIVVLDKNGSNSVHIVGDSEIANLSNLYQAGGGSASGQQLTKLGLNKEVVLPGLSNELTAGQQRSLWSTLYGKDRNFRAWCESKGFGSNPKQIDVAWRVFAEGYQ